ncbi:phosphopantetheine-binding protein [Paenalcaligenes niemegkensis]|uniref:phosphopantetheine-binding protein n=1 Tax=Paenalcaligenes niemegkensis TaxID=2895469 RepID=UPI001EE8D442|nr:phosphopantetheine-binding protein [Paenalcaligenes niemegkensis]MCQ9617590.1 phosphopantetheine-binding protein [Paenalcaligenes niemegkensis]
MTTPINLDSMRADIAAMLHEDPADIHDDDNLMDLGLDSMRAMTLASRWREAGAKIEFSEMAENATLQHWWALVSATLNH